MLFLNNFNRGGDSFLSREATTLVNDPFSIPVVANNPVEPELAVKIRDAVVSEAEEDKIPTVKPYLLPRVLAFFCKIT